MTHLQNALDQVDACVFSGDSLQDNKEREVLKQMCLAWLRAIRDHENEPVWSADDQEFFDQCDREGEEG